jgi:16S rRNA (uracil1498-N3)-methyltransferase
MSTPPLFLADPLPGGDRIVLDGDEGRHAARVRRLGSGEAVLVSDGRGAVASCTVESAAADRLMLRVADRHFVESPDPRVSIVQALAKGERAELAVELATELGADEIVPWRAARSVVQWSGERETKALARWRRAAAEAAKQCRRAWVPVVPDPATTPEVAARLSRADAAFVLHEAASAPLSDAALPRRGTVAVVVGPEGGVADHELAAFVAAGACPVRLGDPVLRTSTAAAAALAVLSVRLNRW